MLCNSQLTIICVNYIRVFREELLTPQATDDEGESVDQQEGISQQGKEPPQEPSNETPDKLPQDPPQGLRRS